MPVRMMGPGQANMANQLSALAKQQQQTQRGLHRPPVVSYFPSPIVLGAYNNHYS